MRGSQRGEPRPSSEQWAATAVLASGLLAAVLGLAAVVLLRDELRVGCSRIRSIGGGPDEWLCADGIGYLGYALVLGPMAAVVVLVGARVALRVRRDRRVRGVLVALAALAVLWPVAWTRWAALEAAGAGGAGIPPPHLWDDAVLPATTIAAVSIALAAAAGLARDRAARVLALTGAAGMVVATVIQPGLGIGTVAAAGLLTGAALRTSHPPNPTAT